MTDTWGAEGGDSTAEVMAEAREVRWAGGLEGGRRTPTMYDDMTIYRREIARIHVLNSLK